MSRFLIEVPHEPETIACAKVVKVFLETGSHFLTHADWGCRDGQHSAYLIVDVESKSEALGIVPAAFRSQTRVIGLNYFDIKYIDAILANHQSASARKGPSN